MPDVIEVAGTDEARRELPGLARKFGRDGMLARPLVFGANRRPQAVIVSYEQFKACMDMLEDMRIAAEIERRDAEDDGTRYTLAEVAEDIGVDVDDL